MTLDQSPVQIKIENTPTTPHKPLNYNEIIVKELGVTEKDKAAFSSELYLLLGNAHGNKVEVANGENYTVENTTGFFAQLGAWYERQPNKDLAKQRLLQAQAIFYDGKKIKQTNEQYGRKIGDTVIASHHQSFGAHNYNPDLIREYETVNCSLGGDEGFALIIPKDPLKALDLSVIKQDIDNNTKKIQKRWLQGQPGIEKFPDTFWEKNVYIAPLKDVVLDHNIEHLHRASDGAATIELIVDKIKKYTPSPENIDPKSAESTLEGLLFLAEQTIFSVDQPYQPRKISLPDKIIKIRNRLKKILGGDKITEKQLRIINTLADRAPYSELFTRQEILDKSEFIEVAGNILDKNNLQDFEKDSLEHSLKEAEKDSLDKSGFPRRWQYLITSSRYGKRSNTEGRLLGTQEVWMESDCVRNTLNDPDLARRSCVGKSGGSLVILAYVSDNESTNIVKGVYGQEITIRSQDIDKQDVESPLDLHLTISTHDAVINQEDKAQKVEDKEKIIQYELDKAFSLHYQVEIWQATAQSSYADAMQFLRERAVSRIPQFISIFLGLLSNKEPDKLFIQVSHTLQSANAACRALGLSVTSTEPVLPMRNLMAKTLRRSGVRM
jgi:GGDEF domain-containing protein